MVLEPSDFAGLVGGGAAKRRNYLRERAKTAKPVGLPDAVKKGVSKSISRSDVAQPLPANVDVLHALQRGAAGSVVQQEITSWLESKEGRKWQEEREELFRGGDAGCEK